MDGASEDVFVTLVPRDLADHAAVREALAAEGLPVDEQTQFAGRAALETAVAFGKESLRRIAELARKLLDADRIAEISVEYGNRKVVLRGVPADKARTVDELTEHILAQLKS